MKSKLDIFNFDKLTKQGERERERERESERERDSNDRKMMVPTILQTNIRLLYKVQPITLK